MTTPHVIHQVVIKLANDGETQFQPLLIGRATWEDVQEALALEIAILEKAGSDTTVRREALKQIFEFIRVARQLKPCLPATKINRACQWHDITVAGILIGKLACQEVAAYLTSACQVIDNEDDSSESEA